MDGVTGRSIQRMVSRYREWCRIPFRRIVRCEKRYPTPFVRSIHEHAVLLVPEGNECVNIFSVNEEMRSIDWKNWPDYLVAFATNECGDFFAYDTRTEPYRIHYIDPLETAPESMEGCVRKTVSDTIFPLITWRALGGCGHSRAF